MANKINSFVYSGFLAAKKSTLHSQSTLQNHFYTWKHPPPVNSLNNEFAGTKTLPIATK